MIVIIMMMMSQLLQIFLGNEISIRVPGRAMKHSILYQITLSDITDL